MAGTPWACLVSATLPIEAVVAVDPAARTVSLKTADGQSVTVKAGDDVKNLDQVEAGDKVTVRYLESVAMFVQESTGEPTASGSQAVRRAPGPGQSGVGAAEVVEVTARVEAVDHRARTMQLRGPRGDLTTMQ